MQGNLPIPSFYISTYDSVRFKDGTTQSTASAPSLGNLPGQLNEGQMPTVISAGTSLQIFDAGTF